MRKAEIFGAIGATPDEVRYYEQKGFVKSRWKRLRERRVRDYPQAEVRKIELITKYRREGFELDVAYQKAMDELQSPRRL